MLCYNVSFTGVAMISNLNVAHRPHNHSRCISAALEQAKHICKSKKLRLTPTRALVLKIIWQGHQPLGAYQIQDTLADLNKKSIAPPTVYRAINFLLSHGLIHKVHSLNAFIGCPFPNSPHSNLFLICENCGNTAEVSDNSLNTILGSFCDRAKFDLKTQSIELSGTCARCKENKNPLIL